MKLNLAQICPLLQAFCMLGLSLLWHWLRRQPAYICVLLSERETSGCLPAASHLLVWPDSTRLSAAGPLHDSAASSIRLYPRHCIGTAKQSALTCETKMLLCGWSLLASLPSHFWLLKHAYDGFVSFFRELQIFCFPTYHLFTGNLTLVW